MFGFFYINAYTCIYIKCMSLYIYHVGANVWPRPTWATQLRTHSEGLTAKSASKRTGIVLRTGGLIFGFSKHDGFFHLDCTFFPSQLHLSMDVPLTLYKTHSRAESVSSATRICFNSLQLFFFSGNLKVSQLKPTNSQYYKGNWKTETTQTSYS